MDVDNSWREQHGFTIVELMVVIAILGILVTIAVPRFADATVVATTAKVAADLRTLDNAAVVYQTVKGSAPTDITALVTAGMLIAAPTVPKAGQALYVAASANATGEKRTLTEAAVEYDFIRAVNGTVRAVITGGGLENVTAEFVHK